MAGAISRGLSLKDFEAMTLGQIVDFCITYNEMNSSEKEEEQKTKTATQEDFNNF